jgi:uncharacterized protein (TIGR02453 family)
VSRSVGIPADAVAFYAELESNNDKEWWTANKERYERSVREPFLALIDALSDEFGEARVFRPYRDVRFTKDKSPYKTEQGAIATGPEGTGYYVRIGSDGLTTGGGYMHAMPDQIARFRAAVDDEATGTALESLVDGLSGRGFQVGGEILRARPKGVPPDHPRVELMRHKSLIVWRERGTPSWLATGSVVRYVRDDWRAIRPLVEWVRDHVGATGMPTPASRRR